MSLADRYRDRIQHLPAPEPHPDDDTDFVALADAVRLDALAEREVVLGSEDK